MGTEKAAVHFNHKGEIVEEPVETQQLECENTVDFCATAVVPDGFTFNSAGFSNFSVDVSQLKCLLETVAEPVEIPNPCRGNPLQCSVFLESVHLVGCLKVNVSALNVIANKSLFPNQGSPLNFYTTVCVDQIIGYTCGQESCVDDCYSFGGATFFTPTVITDVCGRQIVSVRGFLVINFTGCSGTDCEGQKSNE